MNKYLVEWIELVVKSGKNFLPGQQDDTGAELE